VCLRVYQSGIPASRNLQALHHLYQRSIASVSAAAAARAAACNAASFAASIRCFADYRSGTARNLRTTKSYTETGDASLRPKKKIS